MTDLVLLDQWLEQLATEKPDGAFSPHYVDSVQRVSRQALACIRQAAVALGEAERERDELKALLREARTYLMGLEYAAEVRLDNENESEPYFSIVDLLARIDAALTKAGKTAA